MHEMICSYVKPIIRGEIRGRLEHDGKEKFLFTHWTATEKEENVVVETEKITENVGDPLTWLEENELFIPWREQADAYEKVSNLIHKKTPGN